MLLHILGLCVCRFVEMEVVQEWHFVSSWVVVVEELVLLFGCCGPLHAAKPNSSLKKCLMSVYGKRTKGGQVVRSVCLQTVVGIKHNSHETDQKTNSFPPKPCPFNLG